MSFSEENSNNFMMGVYPEKNKLKPSEKLINQLKQIENVNLKIIQENESNSKNSLKNIITELINKLETDVYTLNDRIENFNLEKKEMLELHKKELDEFKEITQKLYLIIIKISKSIELKKNNRIVLLEDLRKTVENNEGYLKIVDELMSKTKLINTESLKNNKSNDFKLSNLLKKENTNVNRNLNRAEVNINRNLNRNMEGVNVNRNIAEVNINRNLNKNMEEVNVNRNMEGVNVNRNLNRNMEGVNVNRNLNRNIEGVNVNRNRAEVNVNRNESNTTRNLNREEVNIYSPNGNKEREEEVNFNSTNSSNYNKSIKNMIRNASISNKNAKNGLNKYFL